jgi:glycine/D-amino acid oxidase-like deaminating enzyme
MGCFLARASQHGDRSVMLWRNGWGRCHLEVYPRASNEIYLCGIGGSKYLDNAQLKKVAPEEITADPARVAAAERSFSAMASLASKGSDIQQACMRPCPPDAMPYLGRIPGMTNAYMAAGHNCWGILWAPVTGLAMTELILDGRCKCVDLSAFDPGRFSTPARDLARGKRGRAQGEAPVGEQW